ncbi:MAG: hypothetical protein RMJ33_08855 [Saprospiraceae bacterium]|nr:DUF3592 domain-containing protein [Saprospiraceae bacterium]MDW8229932.1 hypothetical protein [Saprospiraceae bacterium]
MSIEETEKNFDPALKVVDANLSIRGAMWQLAGMAFFALILVFLCYVGILWVKEALSGKVSWLGILGFALLAPLCLLLFWGAIATVRDNFQQIHFARQLRQRAAQTKATIVGREKVERTEDNLLYVFYQFHSNFVMRFQDSAVNPQFYPLPVGSKITVYYLPENPEVNSIVI